MTVIHLRLDDVHGATPVDLLGLLDRCVWRGRPITLGVIPFPARGCLGPVGSLRETSWLRRRTLANEDLRGYLTASADRRAAEIAVHGLTHADHRRNSSGAVAELVAPSGARIEWLLRSLRDFRDEFGSGTLIPPHNFVGEDVAARCLADGFNISRAISDREVSALGLDPSSAAGRAEAKRRQPWRITGSSVELYQSAAVWSRQSSARSVSPDDLAEEIMSVAGPVEVGVVTFHWWDFLDEAGALDQNFMDFAAALLDGCVRRGANDFALIGDFRGR